MLKQRNLYGRKRGRLTRGQAQSLARYADLYLLPGTDYSLDMAQVFEREAPLLLEIGFGMGDALLSLATAHPDSNVLGIEIYRPGLGAVMLAAQQQGLTNLRLLQGDARQLLESVLSAGQLSRINIFFPDPWPKRKHLKRRLVEPQFAALLASRLKKGGELNLATDWQPYAEWMLKVLDAETQLRNRYTRCNYAPRSADRPVTRFEARGLQLGHGVWDLSYARV